MIVYVITRTGFDGIYEHCFDENEKENALQFIQFCMDKRINFTMNIITSNDWQYWEDYD